MNEGILCTGSSAVLPSARLPVSTTLERSALLCRPSLPCVRAASGTLEGVVILRENPDYVEMHE